uniref:Uncharacterized protein n=1 Tax=Timema shepardi TaxID=629360 RepID=A0A7R9B1B9_TIMSH|nr:unnamed protein product [Timema shepardi]
MATLVLTDSSQLTAKSFEKLPDQIIYPYTKPYDLQKHVIMGDRPAAERACKDPNPIIDGRKANVNLAILGAKPRGNIQPGFAWRVCGQRLRLVTGVRVQRLYIASAHHRA